MATTLWIIHRMRNVFEKYHREGQETNYVFFFENCAIWRVVKEKMTEPDKPRKMQHDMV